MLDYQASLLTFALNIIYIMPLLQAVAGIIVHRHYRSQIDSVCRIVKYKCFTIYGLCFTNLKYSFIHTH